MDDVKISDFIPTIERILKKSDLNKISARDVRMELEREFNVDLTPRKHEVQQLIDDCLIGLDIGGEELEPKVPKRQKKQNNNSEEKSKKSSPDKSSKKSVRPKGRPPKSHVKIRESDYSSQEDDSPPQKKKRGRKPKSSVKAESSDEFERKYERKFEELMNETNGKKPKSKSNNTNKKKSNKRKKRDDDEQDGEEPKKRKKGNTGIHKPLVLSSVLAEFLQAEEMSRLEVVKRLWAYIKENELQDPNDKRYIVCDERLMSIFKQDRIHSFTMNKFLTDHLKKKEIPADTNVKNINGADTNHYENSIDGDNDLDEISKYEDVKVKVESRESCEDLDNEDDEDDEDLFGEDESEDKA